MLRALEEHLGSERVSRITYGAIVGMALIVVLEHRPSSAGVVVGTLFATGVAVALAELYSEVIGVQTRTRKPVARHHLRHLAGEVIAVFFGIAFPSVFFAAAAFGWIELDGAFALAKWSGLALIGFGGRRGADRLQGRGALTSSSRRSMRSRRSAMWSSVISSRERRRRRADSTNSALIDAVITLMKPMPVSITSTASRRPPVDRGTWSP
jgi:hypothetical protein